MKRKAQKEGTGLANPGSKEANKTKRIKKTKDRPEHAAIYMSGYGVSFRNMGH